MRLARFGGLLLVLMSWCWAVPTWAGDGNRVDVGEWGVRAGGGINPSSQIEYYAIHPYVGLSLWGSGSRWADTRGIRLFWMIEPWAAFVNDDHGEHQTSSFEIGVNALFVRAVFNANGAFHPFVEAGEGAVYTDLRKQDLGTRLQFTSTVGAGVEYAIRPDLAIGLQARFRHMSNAGMASSNPGINTIYGLIGLTFR